MPLLGRDKRDSTPGKDTATSSSSADNPKIIKLSNTEYYFPSAAEGGPDSKGCHAQKESKLKSKAINGTESPSFRSMTTLSSEDYGDADDEELVLSMPDLTGNLIGDERLASFKDSITKPVVQSSTITDSDDDDWEETLLYVDLDDIPNVDELFAVDPDDFLTFQSKRQREVPKAKKPTLSELHMKFHNLDSSAPILQIGTRYYVGKYEEPMGSSLMFQAKESKDSLPTVASSLSATRPPQRLHSIVPEPRPPRDKVYHEKLCSNKYPEYELVANVNKVLKMTRKEVRLAGGDLLLLPPTPSGLPAPVPGDASWPSGYTATEILSGKYHANKTSTDATLDSEVRDSKKHGCVPPLDRLPNKSRPSVSISVSEESLTADDAEGMDVEGTAPLSIVEESNNIPSGPSILGLD